jgi:hypothetical protein
MGNGRNLAVYTISHFAVDFPALFCFSAYSRRPGAGLARFRPVF